MFLINFYYMKNKDTLFSAIQPTGNITIGHYLGILKLWKSLQNNYNCLYCIANLHSLSIFNKKNIINLNIYNLVSFILASNINPYKCIIFLQSDIIEHLKLYWILNCYTYIGELNRMTQFKHKSKGKFNNNLSLLSYPVLMASDILLYDSKYVCIGYDQIQHIELVNNISKRFNKRYKSEIFTYPKFIMHEQFYKIMSLLNYEKKMSKSDINKNNVIFLLDKIELIKYKINNCITDNDNPPKIIFDIKNKPGISNLLNILSGIKNVTIKSLEEYFEKCNYKKFKDILSKELCYFIKKLQKKFYFYRKDENLIKNILLNGKKKLKNIAKNKIKYVNNILKYEF